MLWQFIILSLIFLIACTPTQEVCFKNSCFEVETADTNEEQELGLMFRESLDEDKGMLFIYPMDSVRKFWMKNTLIPLDMIWIDSNYRVTQIQKANLCQNSCEIYSGYGRYILEVNQGTSKKIGLEIGDLVSIK